MHSWLWFLVARGMVTIVLVSPDAFSAPSYLNNTLMQNTVSLPSLMFFSHGGFSSGSLGSFRANALCRTARELLQSISKAATSLEKPSFDYLILSHAQG